MGDKTHYRKVFKSDHLGVADLEDLKEEGSRLVFIIKEVKQEYNVTVAGRKGNHNIAYFKENIKPLVLNATNSKVVKGFAGGSPFVEDWKNIPIELYIDYNVRLMNEVVGGVRINPRKPSIEKPELKPNTEQWSKAKAFLMTDGNTIDKITGKYLISDENREKLLSEVTDA